MDPKFTGIFLMLLMAVAMTKGQILTGSGTTVRHQYHFFNTPKTWSEAQSFCRVNYTDLAMVDTMVEHMQLTESAGNADKVLIGLERSATDRWMWSEGIGVLEVFHWAAKEEAGHCAWMSAKGYWHADQCSKLKAFLCFKYDSNGREMYTLNTTPMSWRDAQSFCRQHYTDLVSVKTTAQNTEIHTHSNSSDIWIGLFKDNWMWSDRSAGSFRKWDKANPDNHGGDQNCAVIRKHLQLHWDDSACYLKYPFACYSEVKKRTVVKVKIRSKVNLSLPSESNSLLKQFQARLEEQGVSQVKIRWRADENGHIFNRKQDNGSNTTGC